MSTLLIAGVPRSGKSTIARRIAGGLEISYFPVDALVSSLGKLHPELGITHLTSAPDEVSTLLSPLLVELHEHLSYERAATVLDVYQCFPEDLRRAAQARGLAVASGGGGFNVVYVGYPSIRPGEKVAHIRCHALPGDWSEHLDDATLTGIVDRYIAESKEIAEQCAALCWEFVDTSTNFDGVVEAAVQRLTMNDLTNQLDDQNDE